MKKALIDSTGRLSYVGDSEFEVHPSFVWIDVANGVSPDTHEYVGGSVQLISPPPLSETKQHKLRALKAARDAAILADVTIGARTWPTDDAFKLKLAAITARLVRGKPAPAKLRGTTGPAINTPNLAQLDTIDDAISAQEADAWDHYWLLNDAVQAAFDAGDAVAINAVIW